MLSDELIRKLDDFIRKFYRTLMLKGLFYTIILLVVFYLLLTLFEFGNSRNDNLGILDNI